MQECPISIINCCTGVRNNDRGLIFLLQAQLIVFDSPLCNHFLVESHPLFGVNVETGDFQVHQFISRVSQHVSKCLVYIDELPVSARCRPVHTDVQVSHQAPVFLL